jgi:hypothetical protein
MTLGKKDWEEGGKRTSPECNSGIKDRGTRRQLQLWIETTFDRIVKKTLALENMKLMVCLK